MSEKSKPFVAPAPKTARIARPSTVNIASSSRSRIPGTVVKNKNASSRTKINKNMTLLGDADTTISKQEDSMPDFDAECKQIAYGKFLRAMLEDCLLHEKIEREETQMDIQMSLLADRFQKTINQLDKTTRRLKDINFVVEQKRLLDLKNQDCSQIYDMTDKSKAQEILENINIAEQASLNKLQTINVDFGYDKESGHKQLLDAVNDAIEGLEQIKKHSKLDINKFKEYEKTHRTWEELKKDRFDLEMLKGDFEKKYPDFCEKFLKEASEEIAKMIESDEENE